MTETLDIRISRTAQSRLAQTDFDRLPFGQVFSDHMFVADYDGQKWVDLRIVPYGEMSFSPAISALHYGQAFFEGLKAYRHEDGKVVVFRPEQNARRFNESAKRMCMPELPEEIFLQSISALVDIDREWIPARAEHSMYIRPVMFATDPFLGVTPSKTYSYVVLAGPTGPYYSKPLRVKIETEYTRAAVGGTGYAKSAGNYGGSLLPAKLANEQGFDQLIWTDAKTHTFIEEAGTANIMFVINGVVTTPELSTTILKGVTRDTVLKLAHSWNIPVEERRISVQEIVEGIASGAVTEAFAVGTAATITQVAEIGFEGRDYRLPAVEQREFSNRVLTELTAIRNGHKEDPYGWNYVI
ncbi:MAG: branched-chain amino acid aminotransferase [Mucilaginibacter polytrichastri]|nr:branched-chain amino acid aminotransferase [Mucilaginibacter polytrichastri]